MAITAVQRPMLPRGQAWLAANWPAALWLLAAVVVLGVGAMTAPVVYDQLVDLADFPEQDRAVVRRALAEFLARRSVRHDDDAFGLWRQRPEDGLEYQHRLREEWGQ